MMVNAGGINSESELEAFQNQMKGAQVMNIFKSINESNAFAAESSNDSVNSQEHIISKGSIVEGLSSIDSDFVLTNESSSTGECVSGVNDGATRDHNGVLESCKNGTWSEMDVGGGSAGASCKVGIAAINGKVGWYDYTNSKTGVYLGYSKARVYDKDRGYNSSYAYPKMSGSKITFDTTGIVKRVTANTVKLTLGSTNTNVFSTPSYYIHTATIANTNALIPIGGSAIFNLGTIPSNTTCNGSFGVFGGGSMGKTTASCIMDSTTGKVSIRLSHTDGYYSSGCSTY